MNQSRSKRVVAIYGSCDDKAEDVLGLAERLGQSIATRGQILLTGGTGPSETPLKNRSILGAVNAGNFSLWVGVDRKQISDCPVGKKEFLPRCSEKNQGFLIESTLDHGRNALETCLSDAAICLKGGSGTLSESISSLVLHRPVAFVGDHWKNILDLTITPPMGLDEAINITIRKFSASHLNAERLPGNWLTASSLRGRLQNLGKYRYFDAKSPSEEIVDWVIRALPYNEQFPGYFPDISRHAKIAEEYGHWLKRHAAPA